MLYNFLKESGSELREQRGPRTMMSRVLPVPGAWLCAAVAVSLSPLKSMTRLSSGPGLDHDDTSRSGPGTTAGRGDRGEAQKSF